VVYFKYAGVKDKFVKDSHLLVMERAKMAFESFCPKGS